MFRQPVYSSDIRSVGYAGNTLEVEFHSGGIYQYFNVPRAVYVGLMSAPSHGHFFHCNIRDRYDYARMA